MKTSLRFLGYLLLLIHAFLLVWAVGGVIEMIATEVPWEPFTNPEFPTWVLLIHWGSILIAAAGFLYGYFSKWSSTPQFMLFAYGFMAVVCVIETFWYMTSDSRYLAMILEYAAYLLILLLLYRTPFKTIHFS